MLVYDNGKICVLSATRCGHTSMFEYFGIEPYSSGYNDWLPWFNTKSKRVLVLRNPYDRWVSAQKFDADDVHRITKNYSREEWLSVHCKPYLVDIPRTQDFQIIRFDRLSEYIPRADKSIVVDISSTHHRHIEITPELRNEYNQYRYFLANCKEIEPDEWRELT